MFSALTVALLSVSAFTGVSAAPTRRSDLFRRTCDSNSCSLNGWGGFSSMDNFDNFYGSGSFDFSSVVVKEVQVVQQQQEVVCHSQSVEIIQQRLVVLQEMAKRIITEQICDVETQTIVFEQFQSSVSTFSGDISRQSGRAPGYNSQIAGYYSQLLNPDGSVSNNDLGFTGSALNGPLTVPQGNNWNDSNSPASVQAAQLAVSNAKAAQSKKSSNSTASN